jgi:protein gp37
VPTKIEWTDETWNPVTGCVKVSPGCRHCYAETFSERFRGTVGPNGRQHPFYFGFDPMLRPERLEQPLSWKTARRIFVNSMSDLFGDFVEDTFLERAFEVMQQTPQHTYQILTKRSGRLRDWTQSHARLSQAPNIWLGVSVEDRKFGLPRISDLQHAAAEIRFLSVEPLLEDLGRLNLAKIDWVIVGGESGHHAREVRDQCLDRRVPFFFKQWGGKRKHLTGRLLDGRTWDEYPGRQQEV